MNYTFVCVVTVLFCFSQSEGLQWRLLAAPSCISSFVLTALSVGQGWGSSIWFSAVKLFISSTPWYLEWTVTWLALAVGKYELHTQMWQWFNLALVMPRAAVCWCEGVLFTAQTGLIWPDWCNLLQELQFCCATSWWSAYKYKMTSAEFAEYQRIMSTPLHSRICLPVVKISSEIMSEELWVAFPQIDTHKHGWHQQLCALVDPSLRPVMISYIYFINQSIHHLVHENKL